MLQFVILNWHNEKTHENAQVNKQKIVSNDHLWLTNLNLVQGVSGFKEISRILFIIIILLIPIVFRMLEK